MWPKPCFGYSTKFQLRILTINVTSGIVYFRDIIWEGSRNVSETPPWFTWSVTYHKASTKQFVVIVVDGCVETNSPSRRPRRWMDQSSMTRRQSNECSKKAYEQQMHHFVRHIRYISSRLYYSLNQVAAVTTWQLWQLIYYRAVGLSLSYEGLTKIQQASCMKKKCFARW